MNVDGLILQTRERFPHLDRTPGQVLPLEKGGSGRRYYRMRFNGEQSLILVKYNRDKAENQRFVGIADFLSGIVVNAPWINHQASNEIHILSRQASTPIPQRNYSTVTNR